VITGWFALRKLGPRTCPTVQARNRVLRRYLRVHVAIETPAGRVLDQGTWIRLAVMTTLVGYLAIIWVSHFVPLPPFLTGPLAFIRLLDD
jgi:hypothetical protein